MLALLFFGACHMLCEEQFSFMRNYPQGYCAWRPGRLQWLSIYRVVVIVVQARFPTTTMEFIFFKHIICSCSSWVDFDSIIVSPIGAIRGAETNNLKILVESGS